MLKLMKKRLKNEKGLTLVEVLAVVVILAIVAAIAIPAIGNLIDNSRIKAAKADVANVLSAANIYFTDTSEGTADKAKLSEYVDSWGVLGQETVTAITVTKGAPGSGTGESATAASQNKITVTGTIKLGSKSYTVTDATVDNLKVDSKELTGSFAESGSGSGSGS